MALPMPCGMMRLQAEVQSSTTTLDEMGQASESWLTVARVACHVEEPSIHLGRSISADAMDDRGVSERTDWRIVCAWHRQITVKSRLVIHDGVRELTMYVRACTDPDKRRRRMVIEATEVRP